MSIVRSTLAPRSKSAWPAPSGEYPGPTFQKASATCRPRSSPSTRPASSAAVIPPGATRITVAAPPAT
jgi:hypothetical protein